MSDPVEPTPSDLEAFRDQMKAAIAEAGTTAKALEASLDLSKGTFTRLYSGRRQLDGELLRRAAEILQVSPESLVQGTSLERLLVPEAPVADQETEAEAQNPEAEAEAEAQTPEAEAEEPTPEAEADEPDAEAQTPEAEADEPDAEAQIPEAEAEEPTRAEARESEGRGRRRVLDVPIRAAVAIAGGLALVGGTLAALLRRR